MKECKGETKMLLTDTDIAVMARHTNCFEPNFHTFARAVESAVLAKLREQEPVAWMYQHEDTGLVGFIDQYQLDNGFEKLNPRLQVTTPLFEHPAPIPEGWQLVPKLSDYKMNDAGVDAFKSRSTIGKFCGFDWRDAEAIYIAMLAASRSKG